MFGFLLRIDQSLGASRSGWLWVGQLAVVVLGVHLATDRLDDLLFDALSRAGLVDVEADWPMTLARWTAVLVELWLVLWAFTVLMRGLASRVRSLAEWRARASLAAVVRPLFWLPVSASGAWVLGMAAEDALAPWLGETAFWVGVAVSLTSLWRLALTGSAQVALAVPPSRGLVAGWWWTPVPFGVAVLAVREGLPIGLLWTVFS